MTATEVISKLVTRFGLDRFPALERFGVPIAKAPVPDRNVSLVDRVGFAVGTGRCGTHFLAEVLEHEPEVATSHEREPLIETFHRYCKWNQLPVDDEGFLQAMETRIRGDLATRALSFESSCHLSLSIRELHERFAARFVLLVRHPRDVVRSHIEKGWYETPVVQRDAERALGYQDNGGFHHFLGRIAPRGEDHVEWAKLSRVGKLAWFWTTINQTAIDAGKALPKEHWRLYKLEEFDHDRYREFAQFMGFTPKVTREKFDKIRTSRPGQHKHRPPVAPWTDGERAELERLTSPLAAELGYSFDRK